MSGFALRRRQGVTGEDTDSAFSWCHPLNACRRAGLRKVVVREPPLEALAAPVFAAPDLYDWPTVVLAVLAYTGQIYGDFAGYSDIAIGSARLLGFELPENFRHPYLSRSPGDFWRRWHIRLST